MTAAVKTVLFVDYDSLYLSLRARDPGIARRFASRPGTWIEAIESGLLATPSGENPVRRRILMRRCYADPKLIGKARAAFQGQGFQIVDCPPLPGRERNSAEIHMVLDTIDALGHQTGFEEFILLSADSDLTPVIFRLRSYNRQTTIYSTLLTPASYRAVADNAIDEAALTAILATTADSESPEAEEVEDEAVGRPAGERDDLATLARRIHQATNVPLFPPKVYAELFRALAHEIAENGYHFQATAENVAARLIAAGRNASRRQVAFVVKGLALKGHVFSVTDTPERLAEVFKEQVLYLARNAGLEIDDAVEMQVKIWVGGRSGPADIPALPPPQPTIAVAPSVKAAPQPAAPQPAAPPPSTARMTPIPSPPPMPASSEPAAKPRPIIVRASEPPMPQPIRPITVRPAEPAAQPEPQPIAPGPAPVRPAPERRVAAPPPAAQPQPQPQPTVQQQPEPVVPPAPPAIDAPQPVIRPAPPAPRPAASRPAVEVEEPVRPRTPISPPRARTVRAGTTPEATPPAPPPPAPPVPARSASVGPVRPPARRPAPAAAAEAPKPAADGEKDKDPIESSILAAIAEAVDVLVVEDGAEPQVAEAADTTIAAESIAESTPAKRSAPKQQQAPVEDDGDIGDEIQRILAAYSQNRKPSGK